MRKDLLRANSIKQRKEEERKAKEERELERDRKEGYVSKTNPGSRFRVSEKKHKVETIEEEEE